jgi:hypothetical protein
VTAVSFNERIEGTGGASLVFENKSQPYNGEKPKAIRKQNVVKQLPQLELNKHSCQSSVLKFILAIHN